MMTDKNVTRFPAEWEEHDCVLLAWPHEESDWNYMLDEVRDCYTEIIKAICEDERVLLLVPPRLDVARLVAERGFDPERVKLLPVTTNDTWARDFGPLTIERDGHKELLDFKFNGWGLKFAACHDNLINRTLDAAGAFSSPLVNRLNFVLEGGSVESDGNGTLMTTSECLMSPNRNGQCSREDIEDFLKMQFGVKQVLWIDHGGIAGDDTDSHVDTLARLAPNDTIIYVGPKDDGDTGNLAMMREDIKRFRTLDGLPYNLVELPMPDDIVEDGEILPATYANFLITPRSILLPVYNQPRKDTLAAQLLKIAFPGHEVKPIDCRALIKQHGSLHCVTMQMPTGTVKPFNKF